MKNLIIILTFSFLFINKNERQEKIVKDDNLTLIFDYNNETTLLDDNPLNIKIKNSSNNKIQINTITVQGDISIEKNANIDKSYNRFLYTNTIDSILLKKKHIELKEMFKIKILSEISELYLENKESILDNDAFFNFTVNIEFDNDKTLEKNISIPYKVNSIDYSSDCDVFFKDQYKKYYHHWFASGYLEALIDNENLLKKISTETLASSIKDYKKRVNLATVSNSFKILTEIKKRNLKVYNELSNRGHSKGNIFKEHIEKFIRYVPDIIYVRESFEWDNEYFLIIIDHHKNAGFPKSPKKILDKFKDQWSTNQEYLKIYNSTFN